MERKLRVCLVDLSTITGLKTSSPARMAPKLYATVGSNSNVGENGLEAEKDARNHS